MATKVKLRQKAISGNRQSLYLDFYPPIENPQTGQHTRREFLGLYVYEKPKLLTDKQHNKETLQLAEQIRQKRENRINKPEVYTGDELKQLTIKELGEQNFVTYFKQLADKRKGSNHDNWVSAYNYLNAFTGGFHKFADLNERFCNAFKEFLLTTKSVKRTQANLSQNSAFAYFNKLKATLKQAFKDGYLQTDLNAKVSPIKPAETRREFLTIEELNRLAKTECNNPLLKRAALFSSLTGLRHCDVSSLTWEQIQHSAEIGYYIHFSQQKTKGVEVLPISEQAFTLCGERKQAQAKVFDGLSYSAYENRHLAQWLGAAGITKKITFHCFRHTFATLQLSKGTDIYTVSKMLGHRDLKTTQIYAKVIDRNKQAAAARIQIELPKNIL